jgi:hypothetical protein
MSLYYHIISSPRLLMNLSAQAPLQRYGALAAAMAMGAAGGAAVVVSAQSPAESAAVDAAALKVTLPPPPLSLPVLLFCSQRGRAAPMAFAMCAPFAVASFLVSARARV